MALDILQGLICRKTQPMTCDQKQNMVKRDTQTSSTQTEPAQCVGAVEYTDFISVLRQGSPHNQCPGYDIKQT